MRTQPLAKQQACTQQYVFTQKNHLINITSLIEHSQRPMVTIIKTQVLNCAAHNSENKVLSIGRRKLNLAMRFKIVLLFLLMSVAVVAQFIPNKGQWATPILYKGDITNGKIFFENDRITYNLMKFEDARKIHDHSTLSEDNDSVFHFHAFQMIFEGANSTAKLHSFSPSDDKYNYFIGNDSTRWASNLSSYQKLKYAEIYKGIDFMFYKSTVGPKYDFIVHAGADPALIKLNYKGADDVQIQNNELKIKLSFTEIIEQKPIAFQEIDGRKKIIFCSFAIEDNNIVFKLGDYDKTKDLVIDPQLIFSTYSGSTSDNFGYTATYDDDGNLYSGSTSFDIGYPTTLGAYDVSFNSSYAGVPMCNWGYCWGVSDIAITKYNSTGTQRIYSTYIGGIYCEVPHSLIVNSKGELVIYGTTGSHNYPVTTNAIDTSFGGGTPQNLAQGIYVNYVNGSDIILTVLSNDGSSLLGSTYYGGSANDGLNSTLKVNYADDMRGEVMVDKVDNIYMASCTYSSDIQGVNGFQTVKLAGEEGLLVKFNSNVSAVSWASYLGGNAHDAAYSLSLDNNEDIYVCGGTNSTNLPATIGVLQSSKSFGPHEGYVAKISNNGLNIQALTYFGTPYYDQAYFVKCDKFDNVYIFGQSLSMDSSLVHNAKYYVIGGGNFISKMNSTLSQLVWSTTFGANDTKINLSPSAFMVDLCSKVYLSGWGGSSNASTNQALGYTNGLPVTSDAFQKTTDGNDFYIFVLEDDASAISYASFFGGNLSHEHVDGGTSRFDRKGKIYQSMCAGCGANSDMPIFPANAVSPTNNSSNCNNGVFKMDFLIPNVIADFKSATVCSSQSFQFKNTSLVQKNTSFLWDFGDGNTSTDFQPNHIYTAAGNYTVKLKLTDPTACNLADSIVKIVKVQSYKTEDFGVDTICQGESATINFTPSNAYSSYLWVPGKYLNDSTILHPISAPSQSVSYALVGDNGVCKDTMFYNIIVISSSGFLSATADKDSILKGQSVNLHVLPNSWLVNWSPASTLNDFTSVNPIANPQESTTYTVTLAGTSNLTCVSSDSIYIFVYDVICDEKDIYVPNIFTPNGDGNNDLLYVRGNNILELYFAIYDRWGEKVFETTDQKIGWDGIYKGMSSDPAVFVYYLTVKCPGDREFFTKGNITVMR